MNRDFHLECIRRLEALKESDTRILLHCCCAPCAAYPLRLLSDHLPVTAFFYNPNLWPASESHIRFDELERLVRVEQYANSVTAIAAESSHQLFLDTVSGLEADQEGGSRCAVCFTLRLKASAEAAVEQGCNLLTTTLTLSPLKNAALINKIGEKTAEEFGLEWLPCDFKKKNGVLISSEISRKYGLYRQNYCGCEFSIR